MEGSHSSGSLLVSRLCQGVHLANQLRDLTTHGRIKLDRNNIQSIHSSLDTICRRLSESQEICRTDYKRLDRSIEARQKFNESLEKWMAEARATVESQIAAHSSMTMQIIATKVFDLERRLDMRGIDIRSVAQARLSSSSSENNSTQSKASMEDGEMENFHDLEEKYQEAFRQMDQYERSRVEDALIMEKIESQSTELAQQIKDRLRIIQSDRSHINSTTFSRDLLSVLISDKVTSLIQGTIKDDVNTVDVFAKVEIDLLKENILENMWKRFQPTLAIVDALEPRRR
ncbi:hypothetical protein C0992_000812 [Termitomyces sp. T32_za158]|nr:hypothetical protein C0992_000812 [Termitomyces sp. T32_za158]